MLLRTNWDRFWEAYSTDEGRSWRTVRPSDIEASTAPGCLLRLASGRIMLLYNQLYPRGKNTYFRSAGQASETPASRHRQKLSVTFSEDDGQT